MPHSAIVVALGLEKAALARHADAAGWHIVQSGPGPERAARSAEQALAAGATALVSFGFAGGLDAGLTAGALVVPRWVRSEDGTAYTADVAWHARLEAELLDLSPHFGPLISVAAPLATLAAKNDAAASGAVAVDMESAAIAAAAAAARVPFVAVRVIVDTRADALPAHAEQWIDERGNRRFGAALRAVATPRDWRPLWILGRRFRSAHRALTELAARVAERGLLRPTAPA